MVLGKLRSYLPELSFGEHKQESSTRICHEDFIVIDPSDGYRILAARGVALEEGTTLSKAWRVTKKELSYLECTLPRHRRVVLSGGNGPILVFGDLLDSTGLLFAVRPDWDAQTLLRGLRVLGIKNVVISPSFAEPNATIPIEPLLNQISELFYYMDRIFDVQNDFQIGLWTRTILIANFAGCRLKCKDMPIDLPITSQMERERVTAFLICALLFMRKQSGAVRASGVPEDPTLVCRIELNPEDCGNGRLPDEAQELAVLKLPAFRDFEMRREGGQLVLDALFREVTKKNAFRTAPPRVLFWRMVVEAS